MDYPPQLIRCFFRFNRPINLPQRKFQISGQHKISVFSSEFRTFNKIACWKNGTGARLPAVSMTQKKHHGKGAYIHFGRQKVLKLTVMMSLELCIKWELLQKPLRRVHHQDLEDTGDTGFRQSARGESFRITSAWSLPHHELSRLFGA